MKKPCKTKIWALGISIGLISAFLIWFWAFRADEKPNNTRSAPEQSTVVDNPPERSVAGSTDEQKKQGATGDTSETTELKEAGYIAYWDYEAGVRRYGNSKNTLSEVLPAWYSITPSGELVSKTSTACDKDLVEDVHKNLDRIVPSVTNRRAGELSTVLNSPTLSDLLINDITDEIEKCSYDGIDLDFEQIHAEDRDAYSDFVCGLAEELHKEKLLLSITILPKISEAQDWERLGKCADEFKIMTYDFTSPSGEAGPNSPNYWIKETVEYALENVPAEKIQIGLPLYSYIWKEGRSGTSIVKTKRELETLFDDGKRTMISNELDKQLGERILIYEKDGVRYITYWNDSTALNKKKEMLKSYGIEAVFYWRL